MESLEDAIKCVSTACKQLLLDLKPFSSTSSDERIDTDHISATYTHLISQFHEFCDLLPPEQLHASLEQVESIPADLKSSLEGLLNNNAEGDDLKGHLEHVKKVLLDMMELVSSKKPGDGSNSAKLIPPSLGGSAARRVSRHFLSDVSVVSNISGSIVSAPMDQQPVKDVSLTLFLQHENAMKKVEFSGVLTMSSLQMLFVQTFNYSPGRDDFPKIYIRDEQFHVFYELQQLESIKNGVVLRLNSDTSLIETLRRHLDHSLSGLAKELKDIKSIVTAVQQPVPKILMDSPLVPSPVSFESRKPSAVVNNRPSLSSLASPNLGAKPALLKKLQDVQVVKRDLAATRQLCRDWNNKAKDELNLLRSLMGQVREALAHGPVQTDQATKRTLLLNGKNRLEIDHQKLVERFRDAAEVVDELKLDIVQRGVSPKQERLDWVMNEMHVVATHLAELQDFIADVKPTWKSTWEAELQNVVKEQQLLKRLEESLDSMEEDHASVLDMVIQLQQIHELKEQSGVKRQFEVKTPDSRHAGLKTVMQELAAVDANSVKRMKAIEHNQKMRQRDLTLKLQDPFRKELGDFVGASKLKKTGGIEEIERERKRKDSDLIRSMSDMVLDRDE